MNISFEEFKEKIKNGAEWWMDVEEAVKFGAVDQNVKSVDEVLDGLRNGPN
jgi:hypothetical protein